MLRGYLGHPQLGAQTALVILQKITRESHWPPMQGIETVPRQWPRTPVSAVGSDPGLDPEASARPALQSCSGDGAGGWGVVGGRREEKDVRSCLFCVAPCLRVGAFLWSQFLLLL